VTRSHCLVCQDDVQTVGLCSPGCVIAAQEEIAQNVRRYRALPHEKAFDDARYAIATRNGQLTSAVLSTRSVPAPAPPRSRGGSTEEPPTAAASS
jgi:hypothetical protein